MSPSPKHFLEATAEEIRRYRERRDNDLALCLSGGGVRAMLFHLGVIERLWERGILQEVKYLGTVSGGSIIGAWLALHWTRLQELWKKPEAERQARFQEWIVKPLLACADADLRNRALRRWLLPGGRQRPRADHLADVLDEHLFQRKTLGDLPPNDVLRMSINSTNLRNGKRFSFSRTLIGDYLGGFMSRGVENLRLATAVAASCAYPIIFGPLVLKVPRGVPMVQLGFKNAQAPIEVSPPHGRQITLMDGGLYENIGLRAAAARYKRIIAVDGGMPLDQNYSIRGGLLHLAFRSVDVLMSQTVTAPVSRFLEGLQDPKDPFEGSLIRISKSVKDPEEVDVPPRRAAEVPGLSPHEAKLLAQLRTDMDRFEPLEIELLRYHGRTLADLRLNAAGFPGEASFSPREVTSHERTRLQQGRLRRIWPVLKFWQGL
jgi:NTE family protein